MSVALRYRPTPEAPWVYVEFPEGTDPFAVCEEVCERMFPGVKPASHDRVFAEIMAAPERKRRAA